MEYGLLVWIFFGKLRKNAEYCKLNMESTRQAKIARLLQKELSELFRRQTAAMGGVLVSVSGVRVSPRFERCPRISEHIPFGQGSGHLGEYQ